MAALCTGGQQRLVHELLLGEAEPPLGGLAIGGVEDALTHSQAGLLPQLLEVLLHQLCNDTTICLVIHALMLHTIMQINLARHSCGDIISICRSGVCGKGWLVTNISSAIFGEDRVLVGVYVLEVA